MKRNKLILSTGILLIVLASFSIISTLTTIEYVFEFIRAIGLSGTEEVDIFSMVIVYGYWFSLFVAQSIIYMIYGVKLVKISKLSDAIARSKSMMIVVLILVSCSLMFDPFKYFFGLYVAIIVLSICFLVIAPKNETVNETTQQENQEQVVNIQENTQPEKEKSNTDIMVEKVIALKKLRDSGVLSDKEYDSMIAKSIVVENKSEDTKESLPVEKPKKTYKKATTKTSEK